MRKSSRAIPEVWLMALTSLAPVPGLGLLLNKRVRRNARRAARLVLFGAGALVTVPLALYVICKTSGGSAQSN